MIAPVAMYCQKVSTPWTTSPTRSADSSSTGTVNQWASSGDGTTSTVRQRTEQRAHDASLAACQARPADGCSRDGVQFIALTGRRFSRAQAGQHDHARERCPDPTHHVGDVLAPVDVDAGEPGRLLVATGGEDVDAGPGPGQDHVTDGGERQQQDDGDGDGAEQVPVEHGPEVLGDVEHGPAAGDDIGHPPEDRHRRQRRDERLELEVRDEQAVYQAHGGAEGEAGEQGRDRREARRGEHVADADDDDRHHRADREVDPGGDDHERDPQREQAVDGGLVEDVDEVARVEVLSVEDGEDSYHEEQGDEGGHLAA